MSVRTIKPRGSSITGWFPSIKMQRMMAFESTLERDVMYLLDFDPEVVSFEEQPLRIAYEHESKRCHYTPDLHVVHKCRRESSTDHHEVIECKPSRFVETDENQRKFRAARRWCHQREWQFTVLTETQVRSGFRLHNVKQLTLHARCGIEERLQVAVTEALSAEPSMTLGALTLSTQAVCSTPAREQILGLVFHHYLQVALDEAPLSLNTAIALMRVETEVL